MTLGEIAYEWWASEVASTGGYSPLGWDTLNTKNREMWERVARAVMHQAAVNQLLIPSTIGLDAVTFKHKLGAQVRDRTSGLTGTVVARTEWLYGCRRYSVQPDGFKDGKPYDPVGFDEDALEPVIGSTAGTAKDTGGPQPEPSKPRDTQRR